MITKEDTMITKEDTTITSNTPSNGEDPVKQVKPKRDSHGRILPGYSGNYNGRPPAGKTVVDQFRDNPKCEGIINKIFEVAGTLGDNKPHKDAMSAAKLIMERLIPSLKASELRVDTDGDQGFVFLPSPERPEVE
tara:strand:+ start:28 stop:432 length:405 start_codon:yes stop_codon:yes gene_type:complete